MTRLLVRIALVSAAVAVAVVVSEGAYRVARTVVCVGRGDVLFTPDAKLGWRHVAGRSGWQHGCLGRKFEFRNFVRINSHGLYDGDHPYERTPGVARVLLLGDSVTEAMQVPSGTSFADLLEHNVGIEGRPIEVINAGTSGYSTDTELLYFREEGWRYRPDLVVLVWNLANDVAENDAEILRDTYRSAGFDKPVKPTAALDAAGKVIFDDTASAAYTQDHAVDEFGRPVSIWQRLEGKIYLVRLIRRTLFDRKLPRASLPYPVEFGVFAVPPDLRWERAWTLTEALVLALRDEVIATGADFAVVVMPARDAVDPRYLEFWPAAPVAQTSERWDVDYPVRRTDEFLRAHEIAFVDPTATLRAELATTGRLGFFSFDPHLDVEGHRRLADAVEPFLEQRLSKRRRPPPS